MRKKRKYTSKLSNSDILMIAHKVFVQQEKQSDLAKEFRVSKARIS